MREIRTEIIINAPIEKIWAVLLDFSSYAEWNPFISNIEGKAQLNEQLLIKINPPNKKKLIFHPRIITLKKYELIWVGSLWIPQIFDGKHCFELLAETNNTVRFIHSESFSGVLHIPIFNLTEKSTKLGFEEMNKALKNRCESC